MEKAQIIKNSIPFLYSAIRIEKLDKGYSADEKYIVYFEDRKYLLRLGDINGYERKKNEFHILKKMREYNVQSSDPVIIGVLNELNSCYTIYSYIDGVDVKDVLNNLTQIEQYKIGTEAGRQLYNMHLLEASPTLKSWYERAMAKHYRYLEAYKSCGIKIKNDDKVLDFIEKNQHLLQGRPNRFQHDDFHLGNIIVNNKKYAGVIDFNSFDWGDPLHDFVKVALFQRELSVPFSIGQIKGYFDEKVPEDFWMLYSIYTAMVVFSSVVWSQRYAPDQLNEMIDRIHNLLEDHKDFELLKPLWFEPNVLFR
ncbi:phosphotransferase [Sporosarcina sp. Sa2YVA2]|uniref:Phosphotransferase n=1 Tax=Sporosarcina quadrami TaxID=2762234 RepID=A0ABR8U9I3_9BACL|nr:phosphotransferase [Sporosarcina quadrami]MBD7984373.1 phosphotransferase [Sporosarcina quadrami]